MWLTGLGCLLTEVVGVVSVVVGGGVADDDGLSWILLGLRFGLNRGMRRSVAASIFSGWELGAGSLPGSRAP